MLATEQFLVMRVYAGGRRPIDDDLPPSPAPLDPSFRHCTIPVGVLSFGQDAGGQRRNA